MPPKIAIVVFVKNEFPDFGGWLAWYFSIGVHTIFVHDDHSTDGTWEIALAAAEKFDVRAFRTDKAVHPFTARQRDVYLGTIKAHRDEFDWIGLLDADEFLFLRERVDLPTFLGRFPDAGAMAFSWCIYGSNGHLLRPAASTVEAFTRHSLPSFDHNRSVKSFVRPGLVVDHWRDPHTFEIGGAPYVDPRGEPVRWGGPGGISHDPDWSVAKLMHFIPRSMEHFVERVRRRSDLRGITNDYWHVFNMNDVEDHEPLERLPAYHAVMAQIGLEMMQLFCRALMLQVFYGLLAEHGDTADATGTPDAPPCVQRVVTAFGTVLAATADNILVHAPPERLAELGHRPVYAVSAAAGSEMVYLVSPPATLPLLVPRDHRPTSVMPYRRTEAAGSGRMALWQPRTHQYLSALPPDGSGIGQTSADRWHAQDWELFETMAEEQGGDPSALYPGLAALVRQATPTVASIVALARAGAAPMVCAAAIHAMAEPERVRLLREMPAVLPGWV